MFSQAQKAHEAAQAASTAALEAVATIERKQQKLLDLVSDGKLKVRLGRDESVRMKDAGLITDATVIDDRRTRVRALCDAVMAHPVFVWTVNVSILLNTVLLAASYHSVDDYARNLVAAAAQRCGRVAGWVGNATAPAELQSFRAGLLPNCTAADAALRSGSLLRCCELLGGDGAVTGMPDWHTQLEYTLNYIFCAVFVLELLVKIVAIGPALYVRRPLLLVDGAIVVATVIEIAIAAAGGHRSAGVLSVFRALRLFRIFRLSQSWRSLRIILQTLQDSAVSATPLGLLLFIFMLMFSLMGQIIFGAKLKLRSRSNFDSLLPGPSGYGSLLTVFQVFTGENWNEVLYNSMVSTSKLSGTLYFGSLVVFGVYVLMSVCIAVILGGFSGVSGRIADERRETMSAAAKLNPIGRVS